MERYKIRAHYNPGTVIVGFVEADSERQALIKAEDMGLLDDDDAVDFIATVMPSTSSLSD